MQVKLQQVYQVGDLVKFNDYFLELEQENNNFNYATVISISGEGYKTELEVEWIFSNNYNPLKLTQTFPALCFRLLGRCKNV